MLKFTKDGGVKFIDEGSARIAVLLEDGWQQEGAPKKAPVKAEEKADDTDLVALRAEAEALGLKVHHKAGADKIAEMIREAQG